MVKHLLLLVLVVSVATSAGCVTAQERLAARYEEGLKPFTPLGIEQSALESVWENNLSGDTKESRVEVRAVYLYDDTILVESVDLALFALDRRTGAGLWIAPLTHPLRVKPTLHDRRYYSVMGGHLATIDSKGMMTKGLRFPVSLSAPLMVTDQYFYAAGARGGVRKLDKNQIRDVWPTSVKTGGVILEQPTMMEDVVLFATTSGEVIGVDYITGGRRIDIRDRGSVFGGVVTDGTNFYFAASDYYAYGYTLLGSLKWHTIVGGRAEGTPLLNGNFLYVDTLTAGTAALATIDGTLLWQNASTKKVLATNGTEVLAVAGNKELWVLDAMTGEMKDRLDIHEFKFMPVNTSGDGLVYMVSVDGKVNCLKVK